MSRAKARGDQSKRTHRADRSDDNSAITRSQGRSKANKHRGRCAGDSVGSGGQQLVVKRTASKPWTAPLPNCSATVGAALLHEMMAVFVTCTCSSAPPLSLNRGWLQ
ncbi:unnamed protein product [Heligmosomoides polygyrus]|uniref:Uncharacterized protein n=1 Tax=Heligmosomoides polygyrus TaxID=6339 RepID=A0A183GUH5_HELPZ|nr:unnamed protein product [Heligmosomoides polygyrus]